MATRRRTWREGLARQIMGRQKFDSREVGWRTIYESLAQIQYGDGSFASLVTEGYRHNVWVRCAIDLVAASVAQMPVTLERKGRDGWEPVEEHPLLNLLSLPGATPDRRLSLKDFLRRWVVSMELGGEAFVYIIGADKGEPVGLQILRLDRVDVTTNDRGGVAKYTYTGGQEKQDLKPETVIHTRYADPASDTRGLSPLQGIYLMLQAGRSIDTWNKKFFDNAARPQGGFSTEQELTTDEYARLQGQIKENVGVDNVSHPLILDAGVKWDTWSYPPKDLDFETLKRISREEFVAAIGVPPILVGILDRATYSNYATALTSFWDHRVIPLREFWAEEMLTALAPFYGTEQLRIGHDDKGIPAMLTRLEQAASRGRSDVTVGLRVINEVREELGLTPVSWGNVWWGPLSVFPIGSESSEPAPAPAVEEKPEEEGGGMPEKARKAAYIVPLGMSPKVKAVYWKAFDRKRVAWVKRVEKLAQQQFRDEEADVVAALKAGSDPAKAVTAAVGKGEASWRKLLVGINTSVMEDFGTETFEALTGGKSKAAAAFDVYEEGVQEYVRETVGKKIDPLTKRTLNKLKREIANGIDAGEGIPDLAKRIASSYSGFRGGRSAVIARTETISASNAGSVFSAKQTGLKMTKEWLAFVDSETRDTHLDANGQKVGLDAAFTVGGYKMQFPGDSSAPAEEVVNCRCTVVYNLK